MTIQWKITSWPQCDYDVFLSHCAEDRDKLVFPLRKLLEQAQTSAWLDRHNYVYGQPPDESLRTALMRCRHVVYLITDDYVAQSRGWTCWESAYGSFINSQLTHEGHSILDFQLPLFFLQSSTATQFQRSVWSILKPTAPMYNPAGGLDPVTWAADRIRRHIDQSVRLTKDLKILISQNPSLRQRIADCPGLRRRILYR